MDETTHPGLEPNAAKEPIEAKLDRSLELDRLRLYAASFLVDTVSYSYSLVLSAHARKAFGATPAELGYLGTAATGVYAVGCLFVGVWSDRKGSLPLIKAGLALLGFVVFPAALLSRSFFLRSAISSVIRLRRAGGLRSDM